MSRRPRRRAAELEAVRRRHFVPEGAKMASKPWTSGPRELLDHAASHLQSKRPFDCRIAMISIDNAVELAIRTYLGLPSRVRGSDGPSRRDLEAAIAFPDLLDLIEEFGEDRLSGIELGDIEWYHRLRNTLYHGGNGVTVDPDKVDAYNQVAQVLFQNLFETSAESATELPASTLLGDFIIKWASLEKRVKYLAASHLPRHDRGFRSTISLYDGLIAKGAVPKELRASLEELGRIRNSVVHSTVVPDPGELKRHIEALDAILEALPKE
jgi:hypothetical protein